ncbi:MAG: alpha/beta fold hydrolase [Actinomycetota bacterium]
MIRPAEPYGADARLVPLATGVELSVTDRGAGPVLVLVHGVSMSAAYFHPVVDPLVAAGFRVVVPDLRGHGRSPHAEGGHTVEQYAADLDALLDARGIDRCVVVGWSNRPASWLRGQIISLPVAQKRHSPQPHGV